ncbi:phosphatidylglycerophosphatase A [Enterovibrio sp. ZSDZ35]|uniref:Phosphatidylglycerophosphatase A n=1 Tax=Enterovibrio qingdaonensis TaxID=2899818 RepID=A0ABT5QR63_9GAMM|nr:phosphatidylglycerophosphatase A [Enterovibrio sp. ZSDZ35]MDD1783474.1 phosphatidylglycerophosphatase A [Enterovibrio sp. ZSDZ35]
MNNPISKIRLSNPIHLLATGFGSGLSPIVPGTMGTLAAVPFYLLIVALSPTLLPVAIVVGAAVGIYLCGRTSEDMGVHDHGSIVWDEFVGFWITMLLVPVMTWQIVLAGFVIFRFFDMVKPWPISWLDKKVHGGLGIMLDDIVAGLMSMITLWLITPYLPL